MVLFDYLKLFSVYKNLLTEKQTEVFSLYAECDLSLGEIAEIKGVSRQSVSDTITKTKEILLNYEEKLALCKLVHVFARINPAEIGRSHKARGSKIYHKLAPLLDNIVGVS